jgi:DNA-binding NarL/FixJ family response regulator
MLRIMIVDHRPIFREGLRKIFASQPDFRVVAEVTDGREAVRTASKVKLDIILLDSDMPEYMPADILLELNKSECSGYRILLAEELHQNEIIEALKLGARGFLRKDSTPELLVRCIRSVVAGQFWVDQESILRLVEILQNPSLAPKDSFGLTPREFQIVEAVVEGLQNRDIARRFSLSEQTVKNHLNRIFDKIGVSNRLELAMFVVNHNLLNKSHYTDPTPSPRNL